MPECGGKSYSGTGIFTNSQLAQFCIGIPASGSARTRRSQISLALPSYCMLIYITATSIGTEV
jgi:hypothetical protein